MSLSIQKTRPLFDERTPLSQVPREWLEKIEPKIKRVGRCWLWTGAVDQDGEPKGKTLLDKRVGNQYGSIRLKRLVASWFWDFTRIPDIEVVRSCPNVACLNPNHLIVRLDAPKQRS